MHFPKIEHTSRLKTSILSAIPDLKKIKHSSNNQIDLAFDCDLTRALSDISSHDCNSEVLSLSQAARILCNNVIAPAFPYFSSPSDSPNQREHEPISLNAVTNQEVMDKSNDAHLPASSTIFH